MSPDDPPAKFASHLIGRREAAERTMAFHFAKPPGFTFTAGQFMEVTLDSPKETDAEGNTRAFSIASAPHEDHLTVTTRMRDTAFKRTLGSMGPADPVTLTAGMGDLVLHEDAAHPAVLLAGGIGITPFRSIVLDAARRRLGHRLTLFYSNRRPEDTAFLEELQIVEQNYSKFRLVPTMTQMDKSTRWWKGETSPIDATMLAKHAATGASTIYYVAGPPKMVQGLHTVLSASGIPEERIQAEEFDGY